MMIISVLLTATVILQIPGVFEGSDGSIVAWGLNNLFQCDVPWPNEEFVEVAGGVYHSLGLREDGSIVAWGNNGYGECNVPSPNEDFVAIASGSLHSLGLKEDGSIVAWGNNSNGQCNVPAPNEDFVAVAVGFFHSLGLKEDGSIVLWGWNNYGQCNVPAPNKDFAAVAGGTFFSLGLKEDGSIAGWGNNDYGQCNVPVPNEDFVAVAGGGYHSLGLKEDGSIVAWGRSGYGQCNVPAPNEDFVAVAGGTFFSLGLKEDGSIVGWGQNSDGQCNVPAPNEGFVAVAAGSYHSLGLHAFLHVIDPDSSTIWTHFETNLPISWACVYGNCIDILLYRGADLVDTLAVSAPNIGSWIFSGPVPVSWDPGDDYMIRIEDDLSNFAWSMEFTIEINVGIHLPEGPDEPCLFPVSPNPSEGVFTISYYIPQASEVSVAIYDLAGKLVFEVAEGEVGSGLHQLQTGGIPSGVYFCRLRVGIDSFTDKFVMIR